MIRIEKTSITDLTTDAIVNAANERLQAGGGVCGAIFQAAGRRQLQEACDRIGRCPTGSAVITPGFSLRAKYIIHAVGPVWRGGNRDEPGALDSAYRRSLALAAGSGCTSIGFPLISAGIYGYPADQAWEIAIRACRSFLEDGNRIDIVFAVLDDKILQTGLETLNDIAPQFAAAGDTQGGSRDPGHEARNKLMVGGKLQDAVFFHRPEEPYGFLSNWYLSDFVLDGRRYSSNEQYIMHQKCLLFGDEASAARVLQTDDPEEQQRIGRNAGGFAENEHVWSGTRQLVALRGLMAKFSQKEALKQKLLATGDAWLVECANSDKTWACGRSLNDDRRFDAARWDGDNILGFALMEIRKKLKEIQ